MTDPAAEAAARACSYPIDDRELNHTGSCLVAAAREALQPIRERMAILRNQADQVEVRMLHADTAAETSRHANQYAGIKAVLDALAPLVYKSEELS